MKILAVSGGVDSVVLLHLFKDEQNKPVVAHFDHGIRECSHEDALFVARLANKYGLPFETRRLKLGSGCSEARAREERYRFLRSVAEQYGGTLCTAHHADDVIETIGINCLRGTGWRGLAPMNSADIERPLLTWRKTDIYRYATEHNLSFRQDSTNTESNYLRNRIRERLMQASQNDKKALLELYSRQSTVANEIDAILGELLPKNQTYKRSLFQTDSAVALEMMRHVSQNHGVRLTRPQLQRAVAAVREFQPNKRFSLDRTHFLRIGKYSFSFQDR